MNEIIKLNAEQFLHKMIQSSYHVTVAEKVLNERLYVFKTDKNRHEFLSALRKLVVHDETTHNCGRPNCGHEKLTGMSKFVIDQELELLAVHFVPSGTSKEFTDSEKVEMNAKIDEALEKLQNLGIGQQVIFEEIEELKEYLNLDKKNWLQLLKGKLFDLATEKAVEIVTVQMIFNTITESIKAGQFVLPQ
ncbi:MAG TPA: hypothetical protein VNT20_14230 [Flavisolibacter sp.]|jgi:hypothetical protein|nr:hypothetical protein [Flavisolibacter sp.]